MSTDYPAAPEADSEERSSDAGVSLRAVVADDSAVVRELLRNFMERCGYHVLLASDGSEAWDLLQDGDVPTIAILDWVMPEVEGIELCRRVRRLSRRHYTYILLLTAKNEPQSIIEGLSSGADDYICKPPDPGELEARLMVAQRILSFQERLIVAQERLRESQEARIEAERKLARCDALTGLGNRRAFTKERRRNGGVRTDTNVR